MPDDLRRVVGDLDADHVAPGDGRLDADAARAASAIARSSARPSMRESLTRASGRTSYWVTTGPGVRAHDDRGDLEAAQLLLDDAHVARVVVEHGVRGLGVGVEQGDAWQRPWPLVRQRPDRSTRLREHIRIGRERGVRAHGRAEERRLGRCGRRRHRGRHARPSRVPRSAPIDPTGSTVARQTVWLSGAGLDSGVGRSGGGSGGASAPTRAASSIVGRPIGRATTGRAACSRRVRRASTTDVAPEPTAAADRATEGDERRDERHERDVEEQEQPAEDDRDEDDEGARPRPTRSVSVDESTLAERPTALLELGGRRALARHEVDEALAADEHDEPAERDRDPAVADLRRPLDERAGDEQQHREQPSALAEERPHELVEVALEDARLGQEERDERDRSEDEQQRPRAASAGRPVRRSASAPSCCVDERERVLREREPLEPRVEVVVRRARAMPTPPPRPGRPSAGGASAGRGTARGRP